MKNIIVVIFSVIAANFAAFAQSSGSGKIDRLIDGQPYHGWQIREYGLKMWGATFPAHQYDATKVYTYNGRTNVFEEYCIDCKPSQVVVNRVEYRDRIVEVEKTTPKQDQCGDCISVDDALLFVAEQRKMAETILRHQQQNNGMSQEAFYLSYRQLDLMEEAAKTQKRQGKWTIALNTLLGAGGIGMQVWENLNARNGMYRSVFNNYTIQQGNQSGGYIPTDGGQIPGGGSGNNYTPGDGTYVPNWGQGTNTNSNNNGGGYYYNPGDGYGSNYTYGSTYVYGGNNNSTNTNSGNYAYYGNNSGVYTNYSSQGSSSTNSNYVTNW